MGRDGGRAVGTQIIYLVVFFNCESFSIKTILGNTEINGNSNI
jgi:hypothetical protein